jgi:death-on-curing protein
VDGNKRVAFAVIDVFLRINGLTIAASSTTIYEDMMELFKQSTFDIEHLFPWLQGVIRPAQG